ncbi:MAG: hypothetical protein PHN84_09260 [Desulfuromonadaceae bacterium]|nr:hypothetical protein [Desulfuromonadaceae bacterium]MDD2854107.1 hypothetical protein [Desulfuromonadaceae bacterium]
MEQLEFQGIPCGNQDGLYVVYRCENSRSGNYYFLSNDQFRFKLPKSPNVAETVMIGVANPHFLHIISIYSTVSSLKRIIAVDANHEQLIHFNRLCATVLQSSNRIDYLQRLFKVRFNSKAISKLNGVSTSKIDEVRGGVERDPYFLVEKEIWGNLHFDDECFWNTYGLKANVSDSGLLIQADTVGDINTYFATFLCCSRSDYEFWPFTAGYGSGFLQNEITFNRMKEILRTTPLYMLHADLSDIYSDLLLSNRYSPISVWCSNLLCDYFTSKNPALRQIIQVSSTLGTQFEPEFPEIDVVLLQDERTRIMLPKLIDNIKSRFRKWSVHTKNFAKVSNYIRGNKNIEIISVRSWFNADQGKSKLANTKYIMLDDFLVFEGDSTFSSIVVHILQGHGVPTENYEKVLLKAYSMSENLIILEHNRSSKDFVRQKIGVTIDEIRDILGMESFLDFGPGVSCDDRNLIMVYRK